MSMSTPVSDWLHKIGLGQYAALFEAQDIDRELLADLYPQSKPAMTSPAGRARRANANR